MDDILFVDETAADPAADSIEDVNGFESADDYGYIEYSDEFEELESITETDDIEGEEIATEGGSAISHTNADLVISGGGKISGNLGNSGGAVIKIASGVDPALKITGGLFRNNRSRNNDILFSSSDIIVSGGLFENNDGVVFKNDGWAGSILKFSGGTFSGNSCAIRNKYGAQIRLSGSVEFVTETDTVEGPVTVEDTLTASGPIIVKPNTFEAGTAVVCGTDTYVLSETDAARFKLTGAPENAVLNYSESSNRIFITYFTPVIVQASVYGSIYDGQSVEAGTDFDIRIYVYGDQTEGEDITGNYTVGGGSLGTLFKYRDYESTGAFTDGLPTNAGKYTVGVEVSPDNLNHRSSGQCTFTLEISPKIVEFQIADLLSVYYTGEALEPEAVVYINEINDVEFDKDYTLSYKNNLTPGTCTVTAVGIGNYAGSSGSMTFEILAIPVLVEASAESGIVYDGSQVEEGKDFDVQVYIYKDGVRGDVITADYIGEGAASGFTYQYRSEDASEDNFTDGLSKDPGSYVIRVTAERDNNNFRDSASVEFSLTLGEGPTVTWMNGSEVLDLL